MELNQKSGKQVTGKSERGTVSVLGRLDKHIFCKTTEGHRRSRQASRGRTKNMFEGNSPTHELDGKSKLTESREQ